MTGPATVVKAVDAGKEAADVHRPLPRRARRSQAGRAKDWTKDLADQARTSPRCTKVPRVEHTRTLNPARAPRPISRRWGSGFTRGRGRRRRRTAASTCGICSECYQCVDACIAGAIDHDDDLRRGDRSRSAPSSPPRASRSSMPASAANTASAATPNVVTSIQFERILSASGPYFGHVQRLSDGKEPKKIAFIQCVGSRDTACGNSWCSSVCCMYATKEAIIAKEHAKHLEPTIFFMDIRAYGKDFDRFVNRAKDEYGIRYIRSMPSAIKELQQSKNLLITYVREDGTLDRGGVRHGRALRRPHAARRKRRSLRRPSASSSTSTASARRSGRTRSRPPAPASSSAAPSHGPKDIPETVMEASGAAACAMGLLAARRGTLITAEELPLESGHPGHGPRIGVFVCHCGINIGGVVDVPAVVEYAKTLPNVVYRHGQPLHLLPGHGGEDEGGDQGAEPHPGRRGLLLAADPRAALPGELREGGPEPVPLRDGQHPRPVLLGPHARAARRRPRRRRTSSAWRSPRPSSSSPSSRASSASTTRSLIIGGGLAGMTAALSLADQGFASIIVEKESELGGNYREALTTPWRGSTRKRHLAELLERVKRRTRSSACSPAPRSRRSRGSSATTRPPSPPRRPRRQFEHGVVIVATGAYELETNEYLYGHDRQGDRPSASWRDLIAEKDAEVAAGQRASS